MLERRAWVWGVAFFSIALLIGVSLWRNDQGQKMSEVKFELGKSIVETAKASGVPQFAVQDVAGWVSYGVDAIPREVSVRYVKTGYEVVWQPVFALSLSADRDVHPDLKVQKASLQLNIDDMNDARAQAFVESTILQFQKGKWQRYCNPEEETLLTGRSSLLDENGEIGGNLMAIDPSYKISKADWIKVVRQGPMWRWVGDGVLAELTVNNSPGQDGKPAYRMTLEFQLLSVKLKRDAENLARELKEGDAKGWDSTARHEADKKARFEQLKRLEANAVKRGDVIVRHGR
ncbi:hypothetical protein [Aquabacterium sp.]|uniref:hypothetical protein n=1 Tax=Aquabacterium sp. TaxID=1872578 RepID=UPI0019CA975F|nr:hypothetical protein [Aquabacterium sp.]MBC7701641.1 hypothetical protein [Aquabacterium sp.]